MRKRIVIAVFAGIIIAISVVTALAVSEMERKKKEELYREVELFADGLAIVQSQYVDETKPKDLIYGALKGMLASLDPHSQFMDPETYLELKVDTEGKFGGLGIEITVKDGLLTVITPIEDTPAWKAGLKAQDRIVKINNELTRDMSLTDAVKKMRGKPGTSVTLTIFRESEKKIIEFKITRDVIKIKNIKDVRILEDNIGYIRLVEFRENTENDFSAAVDTLNKGGMNALILDLRNNPGGLLESAIRVSEKFVKTGEMIVYTKGRKKSQEMEFRSGSRNPILDMPLAVLINEGSASGSEIVAACLQDYKRAIIIGTKSFGKGSVQTILPLSDNSALRITTSKYFSPLGRQIHGKGVMPDIVVEEAKVDAVKDDEKIDKAKEAFEQLDHKQEDKGADKEFDYKSDNQLSRAVDVLKAIRLYKQPAK